jgi:hypothetical protein
VVQGGDCAGVSLVAGRLRPTRVSVDSVVPLRWQDAGWLLVLKVVGA